MSRKEYFFHKSCGNILLVAKEAVLVAKRESWSSTDEWMAYLGLTRIDMHNPA